MKLGILQGRLSEPVNGKIQEFPILTWKKEFEILQSCGLTHIEWIVTKDSLKNNPIFISNLTNLPISSICCDHIIDENIHKLSFLDEMLIDLCFLALKNNIKNISIPLLEESNMESDSRRAEFISSIKKIKRMFSDLNFIFETELTPEKTLEIASADNNFFVTYDTGNVTSYLKQHEKYIKTLKNKIVNVHLKDRTFDAKTQIPFNGDTDFKTIFKLLKEIDYNSIYTLQIARGETGKEVEYIKEYKQKFEDLYEQFFV